jgi:hypothetical protein
MEEQRFLNLLKNTEWVSNKGNHVALLPKTEFEDPSRAVDIADKLFQRTFQRPAAIRDVGSSVAVCVWS